MRDSFLSRNDRKESLMAPSIEANDSPLWSGHVTFNEYFDGDTGEGLGVSHQTGWTALVAVLLRGWPGTRHGCG